MGSPAATGFAGGLAGGIAGGMLTSKRGRKMAKKAAKYGGVALLGGLAHAAWQKHRQGGAAAARPAAATPPPVPVSAAQETAFLPDENDAAGREALGLVLMRAMIAAAKADGKLDGDESRAIRGKLAELDLPEGERAALMAEISSPASVEELAAAATCPEVGAEIYLAALMTIETDTAEERAWLGRLSEALGLEPGYVELLHAEADAD